MTIETTKPITEVVTSDLRALIHWASAGVSHAKGGSYQHDIEHILESYAEAIGYKYDKPARFRK